MRPPSVCRAISVDLADKRQLLTADTNGRLFDPSTPESAAVWQADGAERFACKNINGHAYTEMYEPGRNWSFVTMGTKATLRLAIRWRVLYFSS